MKKIIVSLIVIIMFSVNTNSLVYATDGDWVSEAFSAAHKFLNNANITDDTGIISPFFDQFKSIVKGINRILLVLLAGLSMISLSLIGVRYMLSGASPQQKEEAKRNLHTVFIGMAIGFGAYAIWRIAISIVTIIIGSLAQS